MIARPKLTGLGEHVGVQLPGGYVAHRTPEGNFLVRFDEFAQGQPVRVLQTADIRECAAIMERVASTFNQPAPYRVGDNNCEHYASWLMGGIPESPQVLGLVALAIVGGLAYTFAS